jgi:hypothetical protein
MQRAAAVTTLIFLPSPLSLSIPYAGPVTLRSNMQLADELLGWHTKLCTIFLSTSLLRFIMIASQRRFTIAETGINPCTGARSIARSLPQWA